MTTPEDVAAAVQDAKFDLQQHERNGPCDCWRCTHASALLSEHARASALHQALRKVAFVYNMPLGETRCYVCMDFWQDGGDERHSPNCLAALPSAPAIRDEKEK